MSNIARKPDGTFQKGTHWRPKREHWDRAWLEQKYLREKMSAREIADMQGITEGAILYWMKRHGIPRRSISGSRKVKKWGSFGSDNPMYGKGGSDNPNWKGGVTPQRQSDYVKRGVRKILSSVRKRDRFCQRCREYGKLHVHHIKSYAEHPELRYDMNNLICLCKACHNWVHSKANKKGEYLG